MLQCWSQRQTGKVDRRSRGMVKGRRQHKGKLNMQVEVAVHEREARTMYGEDVCTRLATGRMVWVSQGRLQLPLLNACVCGEAGCCAVALRFGWLLLPFLVKRAKAEREWMRCRVTPAPVAKGAGKHSTVYPRTHAQKPLMADTLHTAAPVSVKSVRQRSNRSRVGSSLASFWTMAAKGNNEGPPWDEMGAPKLNRPAALWRMSSQMAESGYWRPQDLGGGDTIGYDTHRSDVGCWMLDAGCWMLIADCCTGAT